VKHAILARRRERRAIAFQLLWRQVREQLHLDRSHLPVALQEKEVESVGLASHLTRYDDLAPNRVKVDVEQTHDRYGVGGDECR
jgi:predicted FMN-binding regulatory protein PaiB